MDFPKIIHQIWLQGETDMKEIHTNYSNKIKSYHKKWKYELWDDIKIITLLRKTPELIKTYYKLEYLHHKVDFARYIILNTFGGVYIDIDVEIVKPLDFLINQYKAYDLILSKIGLSKAESNIFCRMDVCINNGIIFAKPKSKPLSAIIDYIVKNPVCKFYDTKIACINNITGPVMFSNIISKFKNSIIVLPHEYLEPCVLDKCNITENTYLIHKQDGSWYSDNQRMITNLYINYKYYFLILICFIILLCCLSIYLSYQI